MYTDTHTHTYRQLARVSDSNKYKSLAGHGARYIVHARASAARKELARARGRRLAHVRRNVLKEGKKIPSLSKWVKGRHLHIRSRRRRRCRKLFDRQNESRRSTKYPPRGEKLAACKLYIYTLLLPTDIRHEQVYGISRNFHLHVYMDTLRIRFLWQISPNKLRSDAAKNFDSRIIYTNNNRYR